jgi:hypothetical protein
MRVLVALGLAKGILLIVALIGFGIAYLVIGNTPGRLIGIAILALGLTLGVQMARGFVKPS